jgi:hypothetical protein
MSTVTDVANLPFPYPRQLPTGDNVRETKAIIKQLDRSIENIEQGIRKLQEQLQEVRRKRANYVSYISPLRRLPTEILCNIIGIHIGDGENILKIARICSRLREVALGMARIWSNIALRSTDSRARYWLSNVHYGSRGVSYWRDYLNLR